MFKCYYFIILDFYIFLTIGIPTNIKTIKKHIHYSFKTAKYFKAHLTHIEKSCVCHCKPTLH